MDLRDLDRAHLIHPITEFRKHEEKGPSIVTGGEGIRIRTSDGETLIDGCSGLWNVNVGHGRREIADAVAEQMRDVAYYPGFWEFSTEPAIRLAERLANLFPAASKLDHFVFTTGGSEANETAFRLARTYHAVRGDHGRQKIVSRAHAYHGITRAAGSATRLPAYHIFATPDPLHVEAPTSYCFRCALGKNYPECELACAEEVEATIIREGPDTVAAVIAEPVLGTGGVIPPPDGYFEKLREVCDRHGVLLILDEVITGFGRTGRWFGMDTYDVHPDLVTFAKGITSGYLPLGGVGLSRPVYESLRDDSPQGLPFMGGLTYNNHATCCAAAHANIDIIEREGLVDNSAKVGAYLLDRLRETFGDHPLAGEIRGVGLMTAIEWSKPGGTEPAGAGPMTHPAAIASEARKRGLIVRALWECLAVSPPLCTTREEADEMIGILSESVAAVDA
ncbi:MAG: aspartate aminotransferase family protein [Myxococcota bacterium]|jgi:adenosylmethionine-8-amino-7-oxononanoate aminotransferase|nr:aspartate aminotransferase family protein [Myxococcota bacterium]